MAASQDPEPMSPEARDESPGHSEAVIVIPARYGSTRFPGKILASLHGKTILRHVVERALRVEGASRVLVATDDGRIAEEALAAGAEAALTRPDHTCGSERIGEAVSRLAPRPGFVINLQGDEPLFSPATVSRLITAVRSRPDAIWTLAAPIEDEEEFRRPSVVKAVCAEDGRALCFSRAAVPYDRDSGGALPRGEEGGEAKAHWQGQAEVPTNAGAKAKAQALRHAGVYAYPIALLERFLQLPPSPLERTEGLEQMRALEAGIPIRVLREAWGDAGVDTPQDLARLVAKYPREEDLPA